MAPERLTDEQVAEALKTAQAVCETADRVAGWPSAPMAAALLQVSADLSAAKAGEEDRLTWLSALGKKLSAAGFKREDESLMGMAEDALKAFSALQEKARAAAGVLSFIGPGSKYYDIAQEALSGLRSLLPEEGR